MEEQPHEALTRAEDAQAELWANIEASRYSPDTLPHDDPSALQSAHLLSPPYSWTTMTHTSDIMPQGRRKLIHTYGSVAKISFDACTNPRFSGLFQTGGIGLARLSLARQTGSYTPGMGLKVFVKAAPSHNFLTMYRLDGQDLDHNFFSHPFTNVLTPPEAVPLRLVEAAFKVSVATVSAIPKDRPESPEVLPLLEAAQTRADGSKVPPSDIRAPFEIVFEPTKEVQVLYAKQLAAKPEGDMRIVLGSLPIVTVLYNVLLMATREPDAERYLAGTISMTSKFVASKFGDENLFFQHMRHRDMAL